MIIARIRENIQDLETFSISNEMAKKGLKETYTLPLTQKKLPEMSRDERMKKHVEYLNSLPKK